MSNRTNRGRLVSLLIGVVVVGTLVGGGVALGAGSSPKLALSLFSKTSTNKTVAPNFQLKDLQGQSISLSQFKGKRPVLLEFWATWCPYCMAARPGVATLRKKISRKKLAILSINVGAGGDSLAHVKRFEEDHPSPYPVLYDSGAIVSSSYGVEGIPLFVVVNKQGDVVYRAHELPGNIHDFLN